MDPAAYETLRERIDRLELVQGELEQVMDPATGVKFDAFNLSDIFEWMDEAATETFMRRLVDCASDGARIVYWNHLVPRRRPDSLAHAITCEDELAETLHAQDRAPFYRGLRIERVRSSGD
jgi:S-adenosylmethionine-diacylglycerol 3-amino-3-carboxypropyl transferase